MARLRSQTLQMPLPWVFDWSALRGVDAEAATQLSELFRLWSRQPLDMRWLRGERLFAVLQEAAPTGVRDADPAFWLAAPGRAAPGQPRRPVRRSRHRLLRHLRGVAAVVGAGALQGAHQRLEPAHASPPLSMVSEVSTSFVESGLTEDAGRRRAGGQRRAVGPAGRRHRRHAEAAERPSSATAPLVSVSCARLIRVDFIAAGDLLNWVLARAARTARCSFVDAHRLVALFFGAMGINEHAKVQVRKV